MPRHSSKGRHWCFTINNPRDADYVRLYTICVDAVRTRYAIVGRETAPSTGTQHLQGYISFTGPQLFNTVKRLVGGSAHLEPAKGSASDNQKYCSKENDFEEFGSMPNPGRRTDLALATAAIKAGKRMAEVAEAHSEVFVKYYRGLGELQRILQPPQTLHRERPEVRVYVGTTGTGKSRRAMEEAEAKGQVYEKIASTGRWWPGYTGQECVIFNDYYGDIPLPELLVLLDRYGGQVDQKNGGYRFESKYMWFTSNDHVKDWYPKARSLDALFRRLSVYETMEELGANGRDYSPFCPAINW